MPQGSTETDAFSANGLQIRPFPSGSLATRAAISFFPLAFPQTFPPGPVDWEHRRTVEVSKRIPQPWGLCSVALVATLLHMV